MAKRAALSLRSRGINSAADADGPTETEAQEKPQGSVRKRSAKKKGRAKAAAKKTAQKRSQEVDAGRVVRDSFTMPSFDHELIAQLQTACMKQGIGMTKGEILRAGVIALAGMSPAQLKTAAKKVVKIKTGRPKQ